MNTSKNIVTLLTSVGTVMLMLALPVLGAPSGTYSGQPTTQPMRSSDQPTAGSWTKAMPAYEGTIVDLHSYMTNLKQTADFNRTVSQELKVGIPAVLETNKGVILITPERGKTLEPLWTFGGQYVRLQGRLWERGGLKYLEFSSITTESKPQASAHGHTGWMSSSRSHTAAPGTYK